MTQKLLRMTLRIAAATGVVAIGVTVAASLGRAESPPGAPLPSETYAVPPGTAAGIGSQMYPAPLSVPPQVGITTIYPPLAPHEFLYHHSARYRDCGTKTHVHYGGWAIGNKLHRLAWGPK